MTINRNIILLPKFLYTFLEETGANILIPAGVNESKTIWENKPKNKAKTISIYETFRFGIKNRLMKNTGINSISNFLFKNKKLKRAIKMASNR